jgi:hypothetical protein
MAVKFPNFEIGFHCNFCSTKDTLNAPDNEGWGEEASEKTRKSKLLPSFYVSISRDKISRRLEPADLEILHTLSSVRLQLKHVQSGLVKEIKNALSDISFYSRIRLFSVQYFVL